MDHAKIYAQVHRFRDQAAICLDKAPTCYISAADARKLSRALNKIARSIERESFSQSANLTAEFRFQGFK